MSTGWPPSELGPYRLVEKLGSGAMGTVYLAERGDDRVAVKVFHPHIVERAGFFQRFHREAEAGMKVRHPNVVRTLDYDFRWEGDTPLCFLVMEHVEGVTLRSLLGDLGVLPEGMLRELAAQAAAGLAAIHGACVVHRDLKPENVLITEGDDRVRIMDLGVARLTDAETPLTREGQFAGSVLYAPPEQLREAEAGPRSDLYALGVMLYELATGENPFRRDNPAAVVNAHLLHVPIPLCERNPELSAFLSEVVSVLLAKAPEDRFSSATHLAEVLAEGEGSEWWSAREPELLRARSGLPRISVRRETTLHGRRDELARLRAIWERAREGEGAVALVEGEAGIGKTRFVDTFVRDLDVDQAHVLYGSYSPAGGLGGLSEAILAKFGASGLAESLLRYLHATPSLVPAFTAVVKHEGPPDGSAPLEGEALHAVVGHLLRGLAKERPLVWVVEDLHFAGPESRTALLHLARVLTGSRALLVLTSRPGLPDEEVARFAGLPGLTRIDLGRLSPREVVQLLRDALKSVTLADKLGAKIAFKSDGVPFFVFEMIKGLKDGSFISELPDGTWVESEVVESIEVPNAVRDLIAARLGGLIEEERTVLDVASVAGFEFDADLVAAVCESKPVKILQQLAALHRNTGIVQPAGRLFRFDHHVIQEVVYGAISERLRLEYHAAIADAFMEQEGISAETIDEASGEAVSFVASHHLRGVRPARGRPFLDRALTHLEGSFRSEQAILLADRALEEPDLLDPLERIDLLLRTAKRLSLLGRTEEQRATLDHALELADASGDEHRRGWVRARFGEHFLYVDPREAVRWSREAVEHAEQTGDIGLLAFAAGCLGSIHMSQGAYDEAQSWFERELDAARESGDRVRLGGAIGNLGNLAGILGRYEVACDHYRRAIPIVHEIGNPRGEVAFLANMGSVHYMTGRIEEARDAFTRAYETCRNAGYRRGEAINVGNLGNVLSHLGRHGEARDYFAQSFEIIREIWDTEIEFSALVNLAVCLAELGDADGARTRLVAAEARSREAGMQRILGYAVQGLGLVMEQEGRDAEAEEHHGRALAVWNEAGYPPGVALASLSLGRCLARAERPEEAREHLEAAVSAGRELDQPGLFVPALAHLAGVGGSADAAREALAESGDRLTHLAGMESRYVLWRATSEPRLLEGAHDMLERFLEHVPVEYGGSVLTNVALYRAVADAWAGREEGGE